MIRHLFLLKNSFKIIISIFFSICFAILICELALRVKHELIINYDIEMWKYAKKLKIKSENPKINHVHKINSSAILQKVLISTNSYGQRDKRYLKEDLKKYERSFLVLGSSVALGWGVEQDKTFTSILNSISENKEKKWIFVNGGVGNYNTERYINNFFENWSGLPFTDIIVHFFVNDTEVSINKKPNFFIEHTHIGVVIWKLVNSYKSSFKKEKLRDYYAKRYKDNFEGFRIAKKELTRLKKFCKDNKKNCHLFVMPDIHKLNPYELDFINKKILNISKEMKYEYLDLLPVFKNQPLEKIWNDFGDPHPSAFAHKLMADEIFNHLLK